MSSPKEENYLKAIYKLAEKNDGIAGNMAISQELQVNPATVSDMLKRLHEKKYIIYQKQKGAILTLEGKDVAVKIIRKHRLWEVFLVDKMKFTWDEVHEVAEQLEHIQSEKLINRLDEILEHPSTCPHGDPIPDSKGNFKKQKTIFLNEGVAGRLYQVNSFSDTSAEFLRFLNKTGIHVNDKIRIESIEEFDKSLMVTLDHITFMLTDMVASLIKVIQL
jgi:DtxR family transcriptional regulator, Mn-dependent transcriptional regulator